MKAFSYTCSADVVGEIRTTLIGLGAIMFRQIVIGDIETVGAPMTLIRLVFMVDEETELLLKIKFPSGALVDCSA
jgi:hypothetical protein